MKRLLFVGDSPACPSGFGRASRETLDTLRHTYDVTVLAINGNGDPHDLPYPIYVAAVGGDWMGVGRLVWMCDRVKPDVIVIQQDVWNIPPYLAQLRLKNTDGTFRFPEHASIPVIASLAVDGKNCLGKRLNGLALAIFWTQFALDEARLGGYTGDGMVIPLGVDLTVYYPGSKSEAHSRRIPSLQDKFIVGNVNRNQPRKRLDLMIKYFAEWVLSRKVDDAYLYLHVAPTGDVGCDVKQLMTYYGVLDRLALMEPATFYGISEDEMRDTYNCFDVYASTTQGEGMGLPAMEAMACRIPCLLPDWAAYGDWARDAALLVPCTTTAVGPPWLNVLGGVVDEQLFVQALDGLYNDRELRKNWGERGFQRVSKPQFRWPNIGQRFADALDRVLYPAATENEWRDLGRPEIVTIRPTMSPNRVIKEGQEVGPA